MFEGMNMEDLLSKAKNLQSDLKEKQDEAAKKIHKVSVGGGMINVSINGKMEVLSIRIDNELIDPEDPKTLEDLLRSAMNAAIVKAKSDLSDEMSKLTGGLKIPGFNS